MGLVLLEMRGAVEMRYIICNISCEVCTYQPSPLLCDGGVVCYGLQPPPTKRLKVNPQPGPSTQVSLCTESVLLMCLLCLPTAAHAAIDKEICQQTGQDGEHDETKDQCSRHSQSGREQY